MTHKKKNLQGKVTQTVLPYVKIILIFFIPLTVLLLIAAFLSAVGIYGLFALPVIAYVGYRYYTKRSTQKNGSSGKAKKHPPRKGNPSPVQKHIHTQIVKIVNAPPVASYQVSSKHAPRNRPANSPPTQSPTIPPHILKEVEDPTDIVQGWTDLKRALLEGNRHKFLNLMGTITERAVRYAYYQEFRQVVNTAEALKTLVNQGYFRYPKNHLFWLWQCRNDFAHEGKIMKMDVEELSSEFLTQILDISSDIIKSCVEKHQNS